MAATTLALPPVQAAVLKHFERTFRRSALLVSAAQRAPDLAYDKETGHPVKPKSMTEREFAVACHALQPARDAPLYLVEAYKDYELAQKLAAQRGSGGGSQVARTMVLVVTKPQYGRVEVSRDDSDAIEAEAKPVEASK